MKYIIFFFQKSKKLETVYYSSSNRAYYYQNRFAIAFGQVQNLIFQVLGFSKCLISRFSSFNQFLKCPFSRFSQNISIYNLNYQLNNQSVTSKQPFSRFFCPVLFVIKWHSEGMKCISIFNQLHYQQRLKWYSNGAGKITVPF